MTKCFFVKQRDDYSCGPACLATVSKIVSVELNYAFYRNYLDPCPKVGSDNNKMIDVSKKYLPFKNAGQNTYSKGLAIANIIHDPSDDGHYIVILDSLNEDIIYYDPYDHQIFTKKEKSIRWVSEDNTLHRWSVNFYQPPEYDFNYWKTLSSSLL